MSDTTYSIRSARRSDVPALVEMVHGLAEHHGTAEECVLTKEQLSEAMFRDNPVAFAYIAEMSGEAAACAVWFRTFSTWSGTYGIYLEDLYVRPEFRSEGLGRALLQRLSRECAENGYAYLKWVVKDWNEPAIEFYRSFGANSTQGEATFTLHGEALLQAAQDVSE